MHGGKGSGPPKGNQNGVRTRLYARHLPDEQLQAFESADIASLDDEIRLAKANLDWAIKQWSEDPTGGSQVQYGDGPVKIRLWFDVVREHLENVRRLVEGRAKLLDQHPPTDDELEGYEAWIAGARSASSSSPDS